MVGLEPRRGGRDLHVGSTGATMTDSLVHEDSRQTMPQHSIILKQKRFIKNSETKEIEINSFFKNFAS